MKTHARTPTHSHIQASPSRRQIASSTTEPLAILLTIALFLGIVGLSSCAGYASAGSSGGGNPGNPNAGVLSPSAASLSFGNVAVGSSTTQSLTVTNSGTATVDISQAVISGTGYTVVGGNPSSTLAAGQSSTVQIQFSPQSASTVDGTFTVTSDASNSPLSISLTGTGTQAGLAISPASVSLGNVTVGQNSTQSVKLTNSGNTNLTISAAQISGTGFEMSGMTTPVTLGAGQSASFSVEFSPTVAGGETGSIVLTDNAPGSPQTLTLAGSGVAANSTLTSNPGSVAFGSVTVGSSSSQTITLTNSGSSSVTVSQASISGAGFTMTGLTAPLTLSSGESTGFVARFAPTAAGNASATITISSNATDATLTIALSGTGAQGQLSANPASVNFGSLLVGASGSVPITLSNTGTASVTISAASASGTGFSINGLTTPQTINPTGSTSFVAEFAPTAAGNASGSISITSNAPGSPLVIALSGSATATQPQLTISPASVSFGNVNVGNNATQSITLTNSGNATLTISAASASGSGFTISGLSVPVSINAGLAATFTATFAPAASGSATGRISISSNAPGSPAAVALTGTGVQAQLTPTPSSVSFGSVVTGNSSSQTISLKNTGTASLTITQATTSGTGFSISGLTVPTTIAVGATANFNAVFMPTSAGSVSGSVSLVNNGQTSPLTIPLSGSGVAATQLLGASPTSISFGNETDGTVISQNVTLTNSGNSNVTISSVSVSGAGFSASGVSSGSVIAPNQTATLAVTFDPSTAGAVTGTVTVASNATNSPAVVSVSGTGVQAASVGLTWTASTSTGVVGYNVYRGTTSGSYSKIASSVSATDYTDTTIQTGQDITYYYVVTALNSSGEESTDSNQASVLVQ